MIHAKHILVEAGVRYWDDALVDGVADLNGDLIFGKQGDAWVVSIDLDEGRIINWPSIEARIHYKVCDAGIYWLTDEAGTKIAEWKGSYVPSDFLCHGRNGFGDYIIMNVDAEGKIANYVRPVVDVEQWSPVT